MSLECIRCSEDFPVLPRYEQPASVPSIYNSLIFSLGFLTPIPLPSVVSNYLFIYLCGNCWHDLQDEVEDNNDTV